MTRTYNIIGILSCLISFIIMALPMIWYVASALWFFPGAIMILLLSLVIVFCYIKTKNQLHLLLLVLNIIILFFFQFAVVTFIT
ncbi:membrane protein [Staphylococcus aureus]|nr:membrane protein [Staphylococcus aureus]